MILKGKGPTLLLPGRAVHVQISKARKASNFTAKDQPMYGDLHACIAALPIAIQNNAAEIVIEMEGEWPRRHKTKTAVEHLEKDWFHLKPFLTRLGNIEDPRFGYNIAPGHHVSRLELEVNAAARRQKRQQAGGVILAA